MFLLGMHKKNCKNASHDPKNLGKEGKNGTKLVLNLKLTQESWIPQWQQGREFCLSSIIVQFENFGFKSYKIE